MVGNIHQERSTLGTTFGQTLVTASGSSLNAAPKHVAADQNLLRLVAAHAAVAVVLKRQRGLKSPVFVLD